MLGQKVGKHWSLPQNGDWANRSSSIDERYQPYYSAVVLEKTLMMSEASCWY